MTDILSTETRRSDPWGDLSENERSQLLGWNDTQADFPQVCTHELFERQVDRNPEAVALVFGSRRLTYRELNVKANKVAHHLRQRGVKPNVLVGVCLERSPELIVALLAVWKAGGAYVPIDPTYPKDRIAFMIDDAQPLVVLTETKCLPLLSATSENLISLDSDLSTLSDVNGENPASKAKPTDLAYVMYTSGSTGRPRRGSLRRCWSGPSSVNNSRPSLS